MHTREARYRFIFWTCRWDLITWIVNTTRTRNTTVFSLRLSAFPGFACIGYTDTQCKCTEHHLTILKGWTVKSTPKGQCGYYNDSQCLPIFIYCSSLFFLTQSHVAQVTPKFLVFLTLPLRCWDCRYVPSCPQVAKSCCSLYRIATTPQD